MWFHRNPRCEHCHERKPDVMRRERAMEEYCAACYDKITLAAAQAEDVAPDASTKPRLGIFTGSCSRCGPYEHYGEHECGVSMNLMSRRVDAALFPRYLPPQQRLHLHHLKAHRPVPSLRRHI